MDNTATTQEELIRTQLHAHYLVRAKELLQDAKRDGVVVSLSMPTANTVARFSTNDSVTVAPFVAGEGPTLTFPEPTATGQRYSG